MQICGRKVGIMTPLLLFVIIIFLLWNLFVFCLYGYDKLCSKYEDEVRVRESTLLVCAAMFGAVGALVAMTVFHHKTRKRLFSSFIPAFLLAQIFIVFLLVFLGQLSATRII